MGSTREYYLKDAHGNVVGTSDTNGDQDSYYIYDAFGNELESIPNETNPFGYCGEYLDSESRLVYLRNRYYDTTTGRFISEDPIKDGLNWYAYCGGNPVVFTDSFGLDKNLDDYINANYEGKMTATIVIERPVENSREVAKVDDNGKLVNGHTFLRLDNGQGYVNYIGLGPREKSLKSMLFSEDVEGVLVNDAATEWNVAQVFHITPESYEAINKYINDSYFVTIGTDVLTNQDYNIETYNCTTFATEALNAGGINYDYLSIDKHQWTLPDDMSEQLARYKALPEELDGEVATMIAGVGVKLLMGDNYGYTPADAAQDLKNNSGTVLLQYNGSIQTISN